MATKPKRIHLTYRYDGRDIPYTMWRNSDDRKVKTVLFLGIVQIDQLAGWVIESCPPETIVVEGAPYWLARQDGSDVATFMMTFTKSVFDQLQAIYDVDNLHIVAESQAAPGALELFAERQYQPHLAQLTLLQPLGLNAVAFGGSDDQRMRTFRRRVGKNVLHQLRNIIIDPRLRYNHRLMLRTSKVRGANVRAHYSVGLQHDATVALKKLYAAHKSIRIICGANDKLFPPSELQAVLQQNDIGLTVQLVPGVPHSPLATKHGQQLLRAAFLE